MNIALGLEKLGFVSRVDFIVSTDGVDTKIQWLSALPQPDNATILAAATTAEADKATEDARVAAIAASQLRTTILDKLRTSTPQQISDYVDNQVTGTAAQQTAAIKQLLKGVLLAIALDARK